MALFSATACSAAWSGLVTRVRDVRAMTRIAEIVGMVAMREEGVDMIEVSVRTRDGCAMASAWAIIPPSEAPATCAAGEPSASITASASSAMSSSR